MDTPKAMEAMEIQRCQAQASANIRKQPFIDNNWYVWLYLAKNQPA